MALKALLCYNIREMHILSSPRLRWLAAALGILVPAFAHAAAFDGGGVFEGLGFASAIAGLANGDIRSTTIGIVITVLSFLALLAVIVIIAAGIYLIVGMGSDESKEKAKKMILYTIIGLVVVFFAVLIVSFVIFALQGGFGGGGPGPFR